MTDKIVTLDGGNIVLYQGDCLEIMPMLDAGSIDAIITDIPYGTTQCSWDEVLPFDLMWKNIKQLLKPRGVFVTTASQPFTSRLIISNLDWFKYEWIWDKNRGNGHLVAKYRPLQRTESIVVFSKGANNYYPQMTKRDKPRKFNKSPSQTDVMTKQIYMDKYTRPDYTERYPTNLLLFPWSNRDGIHPTQKPITLYKYLIRTYTNEGDTVLDFCIGSGTTVVAAIQTGRKCIGIEIEPKYFDIAVKRAKEALLQIRLPL